jgi:hypothetical protein
MNQENPNPDDAGLGRVLREWKVKTPLPLRFQEQVWRRIEHSDQAESLWSLVTRRISAALARPSLALSYVSVLLAIGIAAGYWQARVTRAHTDENMGARYVQMMDPYQRMPH